MSLLSRLAISAARAYGILSSNPNAVSADYLVVAGGGGGGSVLSFGTDGAGGGGGGGYRCSVSGESSGGGASAESSITLSTLNTYSVTVGAGGAGGTSDASGTNGSNSIISGTGLTTITSTGGGGGGGATTNNGSSGGSGGGATNSGTGGTGTTNQGYAGGGGQNACGGGGAGSAGSAVSGSNGGNGGTGVSSSITGTSVSRGGGGGGGSDASTGTAGQGSGGGGNGFQQPTTNAQSGTANTGGGGGGSGAPDAYATGGAGGSGVVIISYTSATPKFVGGDITTSGGKQIHTFTSSGTLSPITPITASYLVVAGGGGGGNNGGAGAGGLLTNSTTLYSGATYVVTVGAGGAGAIQQSTGTKGTAGSDSSLSGTGLTTITSTGGGYGAGGDTNNTGGNGGSGGGGAGSSSASGTGTSGQGYNGGNGGSNQVGGGGGGSGGAGGNGTVAPAGAGGIGGVGTASSITGTSVTYASGGGGAGGQNGGTGGSASAGGGGKGGNGGASATAGGSGTPNSGGGGGGGGTNGDTSPYPRLAGGAGGSGIVIISYAGSQQFNGGLVTTSGGNTIHTFTSTGALTPLTNNLNNSLRFRSSATAYLSRTPTVAGNRRTFTYSAWVKRGAISSSTSYGLFYAFKDTNNADAITFYNDNIEVSCYLGGASYALQLITSQVFRDPSAWYHIVVAIDTTQATAANRAKLYINGNQVTAFSTATYPSQNTDFTFNSVCTNTIGATNYSSIGNPFDGYMTDINFIDGQALEPYYFGNNDANGVWKPILYKGTYGTNGFYLTFGNTTSTTTLGYDSSPNGNNWTCNNISLTAGTTYDAMTDVPTNTSATAANYAVVNPLDKNSSISVAQGNLNISTTTSGANQQIRATIALPDSGKWYWETTNSGSVNNFNAGITQLTASLSVEGAGDLLYNENGIINNNGTTTSGYSTLALNNIMGLAYDADANKLYFYKNNVLVNTGGTTPSATGPFAPMFGMYDSGNAQQINFGQRPFAYTPPTGYVALNTYNLPTPTILQGNKYMDATLYTGNGSKQVVVNNAQFKPDLVWIKSRTTSGYNHYLNDSIRGAGLTLFSNLTNAEDSGSSTSFNSFNSNGFTVTQVTGWEFNNSSNNYVGWQWQAGQGSTSSNTSGSITSTTSVSTTAGFSIVSYTGTGANATVGHGLGVAPSMIIIKRRNGATDWATYHASVGNTKALFLNRTLAADTGVSYWNNTSPTSTLFTVGTGADVNPSSGTMVAYCWAEIAGFSRFGSYTGNGSTDGPFVYTGFRPKWIMVKSSSYSAADTHWHMLDTSRNTANPEDKYLNANTSGAEDTYTFFDILSNGFKLRQNGASFNGSGTTYIYMAFAEHPFKNSNAR